MKKQILALILMSGLFFSCDYGNVNNGHESVELEYVCNCKQTEQVSDFIKSSIKNANNMNDEEMEDVIHELRITAVKVHCKQKNIKAIRNKYHNIVRVTQELDSCESLITNLY
jgi:hypothetical protein